MREMELDEKKTNKKRIDAGKWKKENKKSEADMSQKNEEWKEEGKQAIKERRGRKGEINQMRREKHS